LEASVLSTGVDPAAVTGVDPEAAMVGLLILQYPDSLTGVLGSVLGSDGLVGSCFPCLHLHGATQVAASLVAMHFPIC
jgi:hypothetical protein